MGKKKVQGYIYATIMGVLTAIICLAIADGCIGVAGTIKDFKDLGNGYHEFTLSTSDPTGRYIFWIKFYEEPTKEGREPEVAATIELTDEQIQTVKNILEGAKE